MSEVMDLDVKEGTTCLTEEERRKRVEGKTKLVRLATLEEILWR